MLPSLLDIALPEADTAPRSVTGGHSVAHVPVQLDIVLVSGLYSYTALPAWSVRKVPMVPIWVSTVTRPPVVLVGAAPDVAPLPDAAAPVLPPQAAAATATAASGRPNRMAIGTRCGEIL